MENITLDKREYLELVKIRDVIEKILSSVEEKKPFKKNSFLKAFGILKGAFKDDSSAYVSELRKEWR